MATQQACRATYHNDERCLCLPPQRRRPCSSAFVAQEMDDEEADYGTHSDDEREDAASIARLTAEAKEIFRPRAWVRKVDGGLVILDKQARR